MEFDANLFSFFFGGGGGKPAFIEKGLTIIRIKGLYQIIQSKPGDVGLTNYIALSDYGIWTNNILA